MTKGCFQNLARAKSALRAQNLKKSIFGATDLYPPQVPDHCAPVPNQTCRGAQNSVKIDAIFFGTLEHDMYTSDTPRSGFAEFLPLKFLHRLSNLLKYAFYILLHFMNKGNEK